MKSIKYSHTENLLQTVNIKIPSVEAENQNVKSTNVN